VLLGGRGRRRRLILCPPATLKDRTCFDIRAAAAARMFLSNRQNSFFLLTAKGPFLAVVQYAGIRGDFSLATPLFAQLLQTAAKDKKAGEPVNAERKCKTAHLK